MSTAYIILLLAYNEKYKISSEGASQQKFAGVQPVQLARGIGMTSNPAEYFMAAPSRCLWRFDTDPSHTLTGALPVGIGQLLTSSAAGKGLFEYKRRLWG